MSIISQIFIKGLVDRHIFNKKSERQSVLLTNELFTFTNEQSRYVLHIGIKRYPIGLISLKLLKKILKSSKMIVVSKSYRHDWVSFCYEDDSCEKALSTSSEYFKKIKSLVERTIEDGLHEKYLNLYFT